MLEIMYNVEVSSERNNLIDCVSKTFVFPFIHCKGDTGVDTEDTVDKDNTVSVYSFTVEDTDSKVEGTGFNNDFNSILYYTLKKVTEDEKDFTFKEMNDYYYYGVEGCDTLERANQSVPAEYRFRVLADGEAKELVNNRGLEELCRTTGCNDIIPKYKEILQYCYDIVKRI